MRTADPWRDTDVIDERAPRFNQAVVGVVALLGAIFGWPLAWALMAAQLLIGLTLGRRLCLTCVTYFVLVQPRFGEGRLEDSRPPRLANMMGTVFLGGAALAWWLGVADAGHRARRAGRGPGAARGLHRLLHRLRDLPADRAPARHLPASPQPDRPGRPEGIDGRPAYVEFTHPLCAECREWEERLSPEPEPLLKLDVRSDPSSRASTASRGPNRPPGRAGRAGAGAARALAGLWPRSDGEAV